MDARIAKTIETIANAGLITLSPIEFSSTPAISEAYWNARRMLIPMAPFPHLHDFKAFALKMAQAKARIWPSLAHLFQGCSKAV